MAQVFACHLSLLSIARLYVKWKSYMEVDVGTSVALSELKWQQPAYKACLFSMSV